MILIHFLSHSDEQLKFKMISSSHSNHACCTYYFSGCVIKSLALWNMAIQTHKE